MKKAILSLLPLCLLALTACTKDNQDTGSAKGCDDEPICDIGSSADMSGYEGFMEKENQFIEVGMNDFLLKLDADATAVYYFGFATCPWCIEAVPIMNEIAKAENQHIYYIDKKADTSTDEEIAKIETRLADILDKNEEGEPHLYVPFVVAMKDGSITSSHMGTVEGHDAHERTMTEEEALELEKTYKELFQTIK